MAGNRLSDRWGPGRGFDGTVLSGVLLGTAAMTALMEWAQARRYTRMSLPYALGTMVSERRDVI